MLTLSIQYRCKYRIDFAPHYVFTLCGKCVNLRTNRLIKKVNKGGCIGYVISSKFYSLTKLKKHIEKIPTKNKLPF
jgi:hypothetical protein